MVGEAELETLTDPNMLGDMLQPFPAVQYLEKIADKPIDPLVWGLERGRIDLQARDNGGFGPELSLGRRLQALGIRANLVKIAIGSTLLATHWQPIDSTFPAAAPHLIDQYIAIGHQAEQLWHGRVVGAIWAQSEADAANQAAAESYASNEINFIETTRAEWPDAWFVFNELYAGDGYAFEATIRSAEEYVAVTEPNTTLVHIDDLTLASGPHFTADSYVELGNRFGDAAATFMQGAN
jgi:hypothetical protein